MKKKNKSVKCYIFLLLFCSLVGMTILANFTRYNESEPSVNSEEKNNMLLDNIHSSKYWSNFSEIHITGSDWSTVENYDWVKGGGSWSNPYIIENITMDASSSSTGSGITIESSTNVYFIIRNCTVYGAGSGFDYAGIKLINTNRGQILDNNCSNNLGAGIYLSNSHNNTIAGNTADNNDDFSSQGSGINIDDNSDNNTITNNHCFNNHIDGMVL